MQRRTLEVEMSNKFKSITRALAAIAAAALLMAPVASARILDREASTGGTSHEVAAISYAAPGSSSGFQWDDAAIGAACALGIVAICGASAQRMRRRRLTAS
jgi:hypothetical protein